MLIACLMPTFGRPPSVLANAIACFMAQDHPHKILLGLDDSGRVTGNVEIMADLWSITQTQARVPSLPEKYDALARDVPGADVFAVWDDDDVYLPHHLSSIAAAVERGAMWCHPERVFSTYTGAVATEGARGRFHGSLAISAEAYRLVRGWRGVVPPAMPQVADFDQRMISALARICEPVDPSPGNPSYVFRWGDSGASHCQGRMKTQDDITWYTQAIPQDTSDISRVVPAFDSSAERIFAQLGLPLPRNLDLQS